MASKNYRKSWVPEVAQVSAPAPVVDTLGRDLANWMFPGFLGMILFGFFLIWKFGSAAGTQNPVRALFIAMNAGTLSGFSAGTGMGGLNEFGQWVSLLLMIGGSLFAMIVGGLAVIRITRMPFTDGELIRAAFYVEGAALLVGTSLLWEQQRSPMQALFLAASSFGNCGLYLGELPRANELPVHAIILPLSVLGGLGLPVVMEIYCSVVLRAKLSVHSSTVIAATAWLYVVGLVLILVFNQAGRGAFTWETVKPGLINSSVLSIETRTGGMGFSALGDLSLPARWVMVLLMAIGASSAGTGGGLKCTTFIELFRGTGKLLAGEYPGRSFAIAFVWVAVYIGLALLAVLLLAYVSGSDPADNILFDAVSALSNVGFTISGVPDEKGIFFAYSAIILVGRMGPLMVLWWMADTCRDGELGVG